MARMSNLLKDENLKGFHKIIKCVDCGKEFEKGGVYYGGETIGLCIDCITGKDKPDMSKFAYPIADAYLDSNIRNSVSPLEYVKNIVTSFEKTLYYSIAQGQSHELKEI